MPVKVKLFANFRDRAGAAVTEIDANTARDLIVKLVNKHEGLREVLIEENDSEPGLKSGVTMMLNGRNIQFLQGMKTEISNGDTIAVFPPIGGG